MKHGLGVFVAFVMFAGSVSAGDFPDVKVQKINDRIYAMLGPHDPPNRENGGYMNNNLVIIGDKGVILVDAGSHKDVAAHIDEAIKTVTQKPITHVLVTHHHSDHHLGLSYFGDVQVIATDYCAKQIADNGRGYVKWMERNTGKNLRNTDPVVPQTRIALGSRQAMEIDGVRLELISTGTAHTDGDMMVWLPDDGVLASGDILVHHINPSFRDGNLRNWIAVLDEQMLKLPLKTVMPGHGPLMQRQDVVEFRDLVAGFYKTVEDIYKAGGTETDVRKKLDMAKWQGMARFDDMMGGNINKVWLEVEEANF